MARRPITTATGEIIRPLADGRWRYTYAEDGKRRHITGALATVKAKASKKAQSLARTQNSPDLAVTIPAAELDQFHAWMELRDQGPSIAQAIEEFLAYQSRKSRRTDRTQRAMERELAHAAAALGEDRKLKTILPADLERWIHERPEHAARTKHHRRARLIQLFRWARDQEYLPLSRTAAEKTAEIDFLPGKREILTPEQALTVLEKCRPQYKAFCAISLYAGVRHQEIRPDSQTNKDCLRWEDIDIDAKLIRIRPEVAKGRRGRARLIPIQPVLEQWLRAHLKDTPRIGPVCTAVPISDIETRRLAGLLGLKRWPHNCMRHSYASYRMAICRDAPRVSDEMGNSPSDVRQHYDAVVSETEALRFWNTENDSVIPTVIKK